MIPLPTFQNQKVAVLGLGRTGLATAKALRHSGSDVVVWDDHEGGRAEAARHGFKVRDLSALDWAQMDALISSPGIPATFPEPHAVIKAALDAGIEVFGDLEAFSRARDHLDNHNLAVITGTNGKSTTTALLTHLLAQAGRAAAMGGNIGTAVLDLNPLPRDGVYVIEASSYQLEQSFSLAADIAILLNIAPDHLERHGSFENYVDAKKRVFDMQEDGQVAIVSMDDDHCRDIARTLKSRLVPISGSGPVAHGVFVQDGVLIDNFENEKHSVATQAEWPALQGTHNAQNVAAAAAAARLLGLSWTAIRQGLQTYQSLPHRMEPLGHVGAVAFYNDSKATNQDAAARAIEAFEKVHWIAGGVAKSDDLGPLKQAMSHISKAYLIGESRKTLSKTLQGHVAVECFEGLEEAVYAAFRDAEETGGVVLLSPACASQDHYRDFADRGEHFRAAYLALKEGQK